MIRKAVFPAAGFGTRFLPATKASPKEMLPLVDKPLIQHGVEEAKAAGIRDMIIVTGRGKNAIEDHFDVSFELEALLAKKGDGKLHSLVRSISDMGDFFYVRQNLPLGLGHAVLTTRDVVGDEPFAVMLPDDIIDSRVPALKQMGRVFHKCQSSVLAVERVKPEDINKYGIIEPGESTGRLHKVAGLIEKPEAAQAPSDLGIVACANRRKLRFDDYSSQRLPAG